MNLLLDTHAALWMVSDPSRLSRRALREFKSGEEIFLSIASLWELANKIAVGKLTLAPGWARSLRRDGPSRARRRRSTRRAPARW